MVTYETTIDSKLSAREAFAYMADFSNAKEWDASVISAEKVTAGPPRLGATYDLVARFVWSKVPLHYETTTFDEPHTVVLEAKNPTFTGVDTITVSPRGASSQVRYHARLTFKGAGRLMGPVASLVFKRTAAKAAEGLRHHLNRPHQ